MIIPHRLIFAVVAGFLGGAVAGPLFSRAPTARAYGTSPDTVINSLRLMDPSGRMYAQLLKERGQGPLQITREAGRAQPAKALARDHAWDYVRCCRSGG